MDSKEKFEISELEKFLEKHELRRLHINVFERVLTLIIAALGLIAALAWDEALKHLFEKLLGGKGTLWEEITYAIIITVLAVLISVGIGKIFLKRK